ncbi:hypothetical protein HYFRA_00007843 [Hymenoscyphus fraxineus]|uniref:Copper transport protein n=1 Tax=Hymenoscyphus fraxineus TaxID=746836 RepID=A0A9N9PN46_9HELO|nr:hypothetical protein HYFRA_00007843 [Hymenoscyphus fraxineus]
MEMEMTSATTMAMESSSTATSGMAMSMGGDSDCKVSMLLNWTTMNACFLTSSFKITSNFTFLLACLLAFLLVLSLEFLRRLQRTYDRYLLNRSKEPSKPLEMEERLLGKDEILDTLVDERPLVVVVEQLIRGLLHVSQFAVSYCVMLLYMSSNGYIIISILCGALVGFALFTRDMMRPGMKLDVEVMKKDCCG